MNAVYINVRVYEIYESIRKKIFNNSSGAYYYFISYLNL